MSGTRWEFPLRLLCHVMCQPSPTSEWSDLGCCHLPNRHIQPGWYSWQISSFHWWTRKGGVRTSNWVCSEAFYWCSNGWIWWMCQINKVWSYLFNNDFKNYAFREVLEMLTVGNHFNHHLSIYVRHPEYCTESDYLYFMNLGNFDYSVKCGIMCIAI